MLFRHHPGKKRTARLAVLLAALSLVLAGCGYEVYDYSFFSPGFTPVIQGETSAGPGQTVTRVLQIEGDFGWGTVVYAPPRGAMDVTFEGANPRPGGPPYVFEGVSAGTFTTVRYSLPSLRAAEEGRRVIDTLTATTGDNLNTAFFETFVTRGSLQALAIEPQHVAVLPVSRRYEIIQSMDDGVSELSPELCQAWADTVAEGNVFKMMRVPLQAPEPNESSPDAVAYDPTNGPTWAIMLEGQQQAQQLVGGPLEFDPYTTARLGERLPARVGEAWAAFRPQPGQAPACPNWVSAAAGDWSLQTRIALNVNEAPEATAAYTCFEGDVPPLLAAPAFSVQAAAGFREGDFTCLGPETIALGRAPDFHLSGGGWEVLSPPVPAPNPPPPQLGTLRFSHDIDPLSGPVEVDITLSSDLNLPWMLYYSNNAGNRPDPTKPVTLPLTVSQYTRIWAMARVPWATTPGPYRLDFTVTARTDPTQSYTVTNLMWVGAWTAPPATARPAVPDRLAGNPWYLPGRVTLRWQAGNGPTPLQYELKVNNVVVMTGPATRYSATLRAGTHTWSVRALNEGGGSAWSPVYTVRVGNPKVYIPLARK